jgi:hypothetical protein
LTRMQQARSIILEIVIEISLKTYRHAERLYMSPDEARSSCQQAFSGINHPAMRNTQTKNASCLLPVNDHILFTWACTAASPVMLELESWAASPVAAAVACQAAACQAAACQAAACLAAASQVVASQIVASQVVASQVVAFLAVACPAAAAVAAAASASAADAAARLGLAVSSRAVSSDKQQ